MSEDTWTALRALRRSGGATKAADATPQSGAQPAPPAVPPATLEDGTPVPMSELGRVLCDCELTRIVMDAQSEPVNLGRTARTYTGAQRRAVIARDGGCAWQGCGMAARWCEVHHRQWWDRDGGETSIDNGVLVCSFHHHEIHRLDLSIRRRALRGDEADASGRRVAYEFTLPSGRIISGDPPIGPPQAPRTAATGGPAPGRGEPGGGEPGWGEPRGGEPGGGKPGGGEPRGGEPRGGEQGGESPGVTAQLALAI